MELQVLSAQLAQWPPNDAGWLVVFAEGLAVERPRLVLPCAPRATGVLPDAAPDAVLWVHWYPYVYTDDGTRRRVNTRRGRAVVHAAALAAPVRLRLGDALELTLQARRRPGPAAPRAAGPRLPPLDDATRALARYLEANRAAYRGRPLAADGLRLVWHGSEVALQGLPAPMAFFAREAERGRFAEPEVLRQWAAAAAWRLGWSATRTPASLSPDEAGELLAEVVTTRLRALVYMIDRDEHAQPSDDWWCPSESPDPEHAAFDCEDGSFEVLAAYHALRRLTDAQLGTPDRDDDAAATADHDANPAAGWLRVAARTARHLVLAQAICALRTGGADRWHSVVLALDPAHVAAGLSPQARAPPPTHAPLWIESTEYTTANWRLPPPPGAPPRAVYRDRAFVAGDPRAEELVHVKVQAEAVRRCGQYRLLLALFLPTHASPHAAEVVLRRAPHECGVDPLAFMRDPAGCGRWELLPGWDDAAADALRARFAPRPLLRAAPQPLAARGGPLQPPGVLGLRQADWARLEQMGLPDGAYRDEQLHAPPRAPVVRWIGALSRLRAAEAATGAPRVAEDEGQRQRRQPHRAQEKDEDPAVVAARVAVAVGHARCGGGGGGRRIRTRGTRNGF